MLINPYIYNCPSPISLTNLVGYYKLDGNTLDSSGNNYTGTTTGTAITYSAGKFGDCGLFTGTSVNYGDVTAFEGSSGNISVFAWVKPSTIAGAQSVLQKGNASSVGWRLFVQNLGGGNGRLLVTVGNSNLTTAGGMSVGNWYHIGFTYNNSVATLYRDGVALTTTTIGAKTLASAFSMYLGSNQFNEHFYGYIDEVSIWQRVLTGAEVTTLYNSTCPLKT